ncbi:MAG: hypothetical protein NT069_34450 [Planctomycetota bacterium]|nr:hypothetical protein [Planctomycetota bacterium]
MNTPHYGSQFFSVYCEGRYVVVGNDGLVSPSLCHDYGTVAAKVIHEKDGHYALIGCLLEQMADSRPGTKFIHAICTSDESAAGLALECITKVHDVRGGTIGIALEFYRFRPSANDALAALASLAIEVSRLIEDSHSSNSPHRHKLNPGRLPPNDDATTTVRRGAMPTRRFTQHWNSLRSEVVESAILFISGLIIGWHVFYSLAGIIGGDHYSKLVVILTFGPAVFILGFIVGISVLDRENPQSDKERETGRRDQSNAETPTE